MDKNTSAFGVFLMGVMALGLLAYNGQPYYAAWSAGLAYAAQLMFALSADEESVAFKVGFTVWMLALATWVAGMAKAVL